MKVTIVKGKVADEKTIRTDEPLTIPQGSSVFVVVGELDAESLGELAKKWTQEGKVNYALELLNSYKDIVYRKFVHPFTDFVVMPLLEQGDVSRAIELAQQITDDTDHDIALSRIILHLSRKGETERAQGLLEEMHIPERRRWLTLLLKWRTRVNGVVQRLSPEELDRVFQDERGD